MAEPTYSLQYSNNRISHKSSRPIEICIDVFTYKLNNQEQQYQLPISVPRGVNEIGEVSSSSLFWRKGCLMGERSKIYIQITPGLKTNKGKKIVWGKRVPDGDNGTRSGVNGIYPEWIYRG
jgi:hypothetical protein